MDGGSIGPVGGAVGTTGTGGGAGAGTAGAGAGSGAGGAISGTGGTGGQPGTSGAINLDGSPLYTRVQRLTNAQWDRAVADVLRFAAPANLTQGFAPPPATPAADFSNNEKLLSIDAQAELDFEAASEKAAALATGDPDALARVYTGADPLGFIRTLGRRAFRRPLTADEETRYQAVFTTGETIYGAGFANGAAVVIRAMLQSPKFLYRSELGAAGAPLDGYEIASKLSFWLLGTTPRDDLLDAAAAGALDSSAGLESAARAMLERSDAVAVMRDFHGQLYRLDAAGAVDRASVPASLKPELAEASYRFFDAVFAGGEGLGAILTSSRAFVGPGLADSYGVSRPAQIEEQTLDPSRIGYFMQVPFLLVDGRDDGPDTIARGTAVANEVLCLDIMGHVGPALPLPAPAAGQTDRARVAAATAACTPCHRDLLNPLGFAFEAFDGLGRGRATDNGGAIDASGSYWSNGVAKSFTDARDLMHQLADDTQAHTCYAKMLAGYALQRDVVEADRPLLQDLATVSRAQSLKEMIVSLVRSPAFRARPAGAP
jgi:hypothetical protein